MRERVVCVRVSPEGLDAFDEVCRARGVRRSVALREAMVGWMEKRPRKTNPSSSAAVVGRPDLVALTELEAAELRGWREFGQRTAINGDPTRPVTADVATDGWTFMVLPQHDDNLDTP